MTRIILRPGAAGRALPIIALALAACNGGVALPGPGGGPAPGPLTIDISPEQGTRGEGVRVQAWGFQPGARVDIGFGPPDSEYEVIAHAVAGEQGQVDVRVDVPEWADTERDYVFVADSPRGRRVVSDPFRVIAAGAPAQVTVTGVLTGEGVECPALRTDQGKLYTLAGDLGGHREGDRVTVTGSIAEASVCMQGTTLSIARITAAGGGSSR